LPTKTQLYVEVADRQARQITESYENWTGFLEAAGRLYKYPFEEQLMIHAQRPDARACAPLELWNKPMNRYVKRGSKGIALLDHSRGEPRLKYVFDYTDTQDGWRDPRRPFIWEMKPEHEPLISEALANNYDIPASANIGDMLINIASDLSMRFYEENARDIEDGVAGSFLEDSDDFERQVAFTEAMTVSATYALMTRCGIDPAEYFTDEEFQPIFDFNSPTAVYALGKAVSTVTEGVLRDIERTVKNYEREKAAERSTTNERIDIQQSRGLSDAGYSVDGEQSPTARQVRENENELSTPESPDTVYDLHNAREDIPPLPRNRADGDGTLEPDYVGVVADQPAARHEQPEIASGANNPERSDTQLTEDTEPKVETPSEINTGGVPLFPVLPTEREQIEAVKATAPVITQDDIDAAIIEWNGDDDSAARVLDFMRDNGRARHTAEWLKNEYGGDLSAFTVEKDGAEAVTLSWQKVQQRIGQLVSAGIIVIPEKQAHEEAEPTRSELFQAFYDRFGNDADLAAALETAFENSRQDSFIDNIVKQRRIKAAFYGVMGDTEKTEQAFDIVTRQFSPDEPTQSQTAPEAVEPESAPAPETVEPAPAAVEAAEPPPTPPPVFFPDWEKAQFDFDLKLYNDGDVIGYNRDGVKTSLGRMGDLTYITTTGMFWGSNEVPGNIYEQIQAYRNGEVTDEQARENYLDVLEDYKEQIRERPTPEQARKILYGLVDKVRSGNLHYADVDDAVYTLKLSLAEFGDQNPERHYGAEAYAYWNISGERRDNDMVRIDYNFNEDGSAGKVLNIEIDFTTFGIEPPPPTLAETEHENRVIMNTEAATSQFRETWADGLTEESQTREDITPPQSEQFSIFDYPDAPLTADAPETPTTAIAAYVKSKLETGVKFTSAELYAEAARAYGDTMANNAFTPKDAYDAMELGVNQYILSSGDMSVEKTLSMLDLLPTQTRRTADMEMYQQFSTPPSIAYLANWTANVNASDIMLEPSAGIGGIAVFAKKDGATVYVNELDKRRLEVIKNLPFDGFYNEDAEQINNIYGGKIEPTVIVMNPPFSSSAERNMHNTKIGAKHIEEALKLLTPNGRLVAVVGQGMADDAPAFRDWWRGIKAEYNVKANIGIDGKNYSKYGTSFGIQMLVIDKNGATTEPVKTAFVENVLDLQNILGVIRNERPNARPDIDSGNERNPVTTARPDAVSEREPERERSGVVFDASRITDTAVVGDRPKQTDTSEVNTAVRGTPGAAPGHTDVLDDGIAQIIDGGRQSGNDGRNDVIDGIGRTGVADSGQPHGRVEPRVKPPKPVKTELTDSIFEQYEPQPLLLHNVQPHPANISESAAMSAIQPPPVTYKPQLSQDLIDKGVLSDVQLEAVTYAGQSHNQTLPNGNARGFFLGDGTGVGKGRTITGIILDNYVQGRHKAVWLSENTGLIPDTKRDVTALFGNSDLVQEFRGGKSADKSLSISDGVLFTTYSSLSKGFDQSGSNYEKIINWLGKDFDGVIVFDEAHNMANSIAHKGNRGVKKASQRGMAGLAIQEALPNAKIVYSSATGATEVENLRYAERLGLWGEGTAFPNGDDFVHKIKAGGLAAMELIARDMKAMGVYLSRNISYDDVAYDKIVHELTPGQRQIYDELARSWQIVLKNINDALKTTHQDKDGTAKGKAYGAFWSAEQRFFNQILTAMQVPSMITDIQKQLDDGNSIVIQLVSTNEAAQEREFTRLQEQDLELEDFDLTPKQMLMSYIENSFPTMQFEEYTDDNGNVKSKPVFDSAGNPVINREAVRQKEMLLDKLGSIKVPASALDMIINHFGSDMVAENTGRQRRVVVKDGKATEENIASKKQADVSAFQDGDKRIIIFSKAGGTGKSYHADKSAKNQQHRVHYLLQAGWQADAAVQGFGRSHRSNQVSAPTFSLVTTDLKGQMRFISTIAKRLDQLGALTKGQRQTGSQGMFTAGDNLENSFASDVLAGYYKSLILNRVDGVSDGVGIVAKLGLKDKLLDEYGSFNPNAQELREVNKFLNRILSLECAEQNAVFDGYAERLQIATEKAMQEGTLDKGLENYRADKVILNETHDIRADEATGATTKYFNLTAHNKIKPLQFADVNVKNSAFMGFYQSKNTGAVRAVFKTSSVTDEHGNITDNCRLTGQDGNEYMPLNRLVSNWKQLTPEKAETLWNKAVDELPEYRTNNLHLIGGTVLPVWDKLPTENVRIYRVLTSDGDLLIGRVIPEDLIDATLHKLGASRTREAIATEDLVKHIKNGDTVHLDNDWRLVQRRVSNEQRIELIGADYLHSDMLTKKGVFTERIAYQTRYFIPAETDTIRILDDIFKIAPVNRVERSGDRVAAKSHVAKGKPSVLESLDRYAEKSREMFSGGGTDKPKREDVLV